MEPVKTLAELHSVNRERAKLDRNLAFTTYPELLYPIFLLPCTVKILMVTDAGGAFTDQDFGLTELLDVLSVSPGPYVRFAVTKAHRSAGGMYTVNADLVNFRFDQTDLTSFDQIWMIAVSSGGVQPLTGAELKAISQFMDGGGGLFATGDHADLGVDMCGRIPRVRNMRKWHYPLPGPNGEPVAPGGFDHTRLDTNQPGHDSTLTFDDQSDDIPQTIVPVMHAVPSPFLFRRDSVPHPLLCGPRGIIRVLPDHPHEGECYVPNDLTAQFTFDGYTITEYPTLPDGTRLSPEIVSYSHSGVGITDQAKQTGSTRVFGANCAYDGHRTSVGRVAVESTWHHLFNINLKGYPPDADPIKQHGFHASAAGMAKYEDIKAYFRNIAVWLARPATQNCMRWRAIWASRWDSRIFMDLLPVRDIAKLDLHELVRIGIVGRDVLGRYASQCQVSIWILDWLKEFKLRLPIEYIHPWPPPPPGPPIELDPVIYYYTKSLIDASLGALIYAIAARFPEATEETKRAADSDVHRELMAEAVKIAQVQVLAKLRSSLKTATEFVR